MDFFEAVILLLLVLCALSVAFIKNTLSAIIVFMAYSLLMSIIWIILKAPDLAITEAAVGAGVTTILFLVTLKKIHQIVKENSHAQTKE